MKMLKYCTRCFRVYESYLTIHVCGCGGNVEYVGSRKAAWDPALMRHLTRAGADALPPCDCGMGDATMPEYHAECCAVNRRGSA
jgi:hypothetical protein